MSNHEPPEGWQWGIGERVSQSCYTHWAYHENWEIEMYSDPEQPHTVNLYKILGIKDDGDRDVDEYPTRSKQFETQDEAEQFVLELMEEYQ